MASAGIRFLAGDSGDWHIKDINAYRGESLPSAARLSRSRADAPMHDGHRAWSLQGFTSNLRYTERDELRRLREQQEGLGRIDSLCAALIPIRKNEAWWALAQDERRAIFESHSRHIGIGLNYLPEIARQLIHCRDIDDRFDFLTWFEFKPEHADLFDRLLEQLRATEEWTFVDREVEIRLEFAP
jgi:chlorite dismutase